MGSFLGVQGHKGLPPHQNAPATLKNDSAPAEAVPPRPSRQANHQLAHMRAACSAVAVAIERACLSFRGTLLPRRGLKLGYLVQEDGEQIRGGLVSGAAGAGAPPQGNWIAGEGTGKSFC
jgi:hypothetical protein